MLKAKAANDQFLEGLQVTQVLDCIRKFPDIMKSLFCFNKYVLTAGNDKGKQARMAKLHINSKFKISVADCLKSLFHLAFCDPEDPNRAKQEAAYVYFTDFLDECEGKRDIS